jgi:hypothetical protein
MKVDPIISIPTAILFILIGLYCFAVTSSIEKIETPQIIYNQFTVTNLNAFDVDAALSNISSANQSFDQEHSYMYCNMIYINMCGLVLLISALYIAMNTK